MRFPLMMKSLAGLCGGAAGLLCMVAPGSSAAQTPVDHLVRAAPVSPATASGYYLPFGTTFTQTVVSGDPSVSAAEEVACDTGSGYSYPSTYPDHTEVKELARGLEYSPTAIFAWVRDNIEVHPVFGASKGALGALFDKEGSPFDQAMLAAELLREANGKNGQTISVVYQIGTVALTPQQLTDWTGISDAKAVCRLLGSGGIPTTINGSSNCASVSGAITSAEIGHVWLSVTVNGVTERWDPAFKVHEILPGISLAPAMGYSAGTATTAARSTETTGTASSVPYTEGLNQPGVYSVMDTRSAALDTQFQGALIDDTLKEVTGGMEIVPAAAGASKAPLTTYTAWTGMTALTNIPDQFRTKVTVAINTSSLVAPLYADEVYGRRFAIITSGFGAGTCAQTGSYQFRAELMLDGKVIRTVGNTLLSYTAAIAPNARELPVSLAIDHPYAADSGAYGDRTENYTVTLVTDAVIALGFGTTTDQLVSQMLSDDDRERMNPGYSSLGTLSDFPPPRTLRLRYQSAAGWLAQRSQLQEMNGAVGDADVITHHIAGLVYGFATVRHAVVGGSGGTIEDTVVDENIQLDMRAVTSVESLTATDTQRLAVFRAGAAASATLEGALIQQNANAVDAASTATKFADATRLYDFTGASTPSITAVTSVGTGAPAAVDISIYRTALTSAVATGQTVIAPGVYWLGPGEQCGYWLAIGGPPACFPGGTRGGAIVTTTSGLDEVGHTLVYKSAAFKGGGGAGISTEIKSLNIPTAPELLELRTTLADVAQINPQSGALIYAAPPLITTGAGNFPYSLSFQPQIRSGVGAAGLDVAGNPTPYPDNLTYTLALSGSALEAMGKTQPRNAVPTLVALVIAQDIYSAATTTSWDRIAQEATALYAMNWWGKTLAGNTAALTLGAENQTFVRRWNGTWAPPPGSVSQLVQTGARTPQSWPPLYPTQRRWDDHSVTFKYVSESQDETDFAYWEARQLTPDGGGGFYQNYVGTGWNGSQIRYKPGVTVDFTYAQTDCGSGIHCQPPYRVSVANSLGRSLTFAAITSGNTITDDTGRSATLVASGSNINMTNPAGETTVYATGTVLGARPTYLPQALLSVSTPEDVTAGAGASLKFTYDGLMRVATTQIATARSGGVTTYATTQGLYAEGRRYETIDPVGSRSLMYFDDYDHAYATIDPFGRRTETDFDGLGRKTEERLRWNDASVDHTQYRTTYAYDANSSLLSTSIYPKINASGFQLPGSPIVTSSVYGVTNYPRLPSQSIDANNHATSFTYNTRGLQETATGPVGELTTTAYNSRGLPTSVTTKISATENRVVTTDYNATTGLPETSTVVHPTTPANNLITHFEWNARGDLTAVVDPESRRAEATYDLARRQLTTSRGAGTADRTDTAYVYDHDGRMTALRRKRLDTPTPTGTWVETDLAYEPDGRLHSITDPNGDVTRFAWDSRRWLQNMTDGSGRQTRYFYTTDGKPSCVQVAVGTAEIATERMTGYGIEGQPTVLWPGRSDPTVACNETASGYRTVFYYDAWGRQDFTLFPGGTSETRTRDPAANITTFLNRSGQTLTSTFDNSNRETGRTTPEGSYTFAYNLAAEPTQSDGIGGARTTWLYDFAGRTTDEGTRFATGGATATVSYGYDKSGLRTRITWPDGWDATYTYDSVGRMRTVNDDAGARIATLTPDKLDRRVETAFGASGSPVSRLLLSWRDDGDLLGLDHRFTGSSTVTEALSHDGAGRLTVRNVSDAGWSWIPGSAVNQTFDTANVLDQNLLVQGQALTWDTRGNLLTWGGWTYSHDSANRLLTAAATGTSASYRYDAQGRRIEKTVNGTVTRFLSAGDEEIADLDNTNATLQRVIPGAGVDEHLATITAAGARTYLHVNHQGSITALADAAGARTKVYAYDGYGNEAGGASSDPNPWRFTGRRRDPETGLYYYRARYYSPVLGRFVETDPVGYEDQVNLYSYVGGDPLDLTDPSGEVQYCNCTVWEDGESFADTSQDREPPARADDPISRAVYRLSDWIVDAAPAPGYAVANLATGRGNRGDVETVIVFGLAVTVPEAIAEELGSLEGVTVLSAESRAFSATIEDVLANPRLMEGRSLAEVAPVLERSAGSNWEVGTLNRGSRQGQGWALRERAPNGSYTDRSVRYHPGGGHHGDYPYFRVTSGRYGNQGPIRAR